MNNNTSQLLYKNKQRFFIVICLLMAICTHAFATENDQETTTEFLAQKWIGDFDGMKQRRLIRVLVVFNKMMYFLDNGSQRGISYEALKLFEKELNEKLNNKVVKVHVVFIPVSREQLIPSLINGYGDIAAANLTITENRKKQIDFTNPLLKKVKEILITGPSSPSISSFEDLSGEEIYVRFSSSYYERLVNYNIKLNANGKAPIILLPAPEIFEDSDILEMVNAGMTSYAIVDLHKARFWEKIFKKITLHENINFGGDASIGWAFRKNSPKLKAVLNDFVKRNKKGTYIGNILFNRYLKTNKWVKNSLSDTSIDRFDQLVDYFKKYAETYNFDWLMLAALGYQESQLDQTRRSHVGAIGVMQLMPTTASDKNVDINDIHITESNIHAGTKYLRFIRDRYFTNTEINSLDSILFSFAAYNAGPARINRIRKEAKEAGLNPNKWFNNVELIVAKRIGRETVQYVSNIYKYYITYQLLIRQNERREKVKQSLREL